MYAVGLHVTHPQKWKAQFLCELPYFPRLAMLLFGADSFLSASVYIFWNSLFKVKEYDITQLLELAGSAPLQVFLVGVGILLMLGAMVLVNFVMYRAFGEWLNADKDRYQEKDNYRVLLPLLVLFLADCSRWITNALLMDIGWWSMLVMMMLTLVVLAGIYYFNPEVRRLRISRKKAVLPIITAFVVAIISFAAVVLLF